MILNEFIFQINTIKIMFGQKKKIYIHIYIYINFNKFSMKRQGLVILIVEGEGNNITKKRRVNTVNERKGRAV